MSGSVRTIAHPGPRHAERTVSAGCSVRRRRLRLRAGLAFDEAVYRALAETGSESAYVRLSGLRVRPLRYVIPAVSPDGAHAAWYSETFAPEGAATLEDAGLFVGSRDGAPFLHCHGVFVSAAGRAGGHLRPSETFVSEDLECEALCIDGALMQVQPDDETRFPLFRPVLLSRAGRCDRGIIAAVRPNEDLGTAVADLCRHAGIASACVHGIGSLVGADFADGRHVSSFATEVLVQSGNYESGKVELEIAMVGLDGGLSRGRLTGINPVCVTFELLIEARA